ncbi:MULTISPECIES: LacI family DNA-binding transcriptional regulator [Lelliottia]|jgi:DNA-binding LacI/PurR family transcriptional regulator|uniref:LacI family DNA-binding transcriptional regulator n=1 Tax=Lelliottia nimipressuralis TaxID=69220 RepID=A0ABD4K429_9ENTR|nr:MULTISPECIES: LacI family DNA-binding transcriptional regulator [Lelliottia]MDH6631433.1 DNA-binding LacI/PurR family transcriptional regulator [Lelliottia amnigena]QMM54092.1 LacI family DNA-binding transcriptional regulator [Enterobacter sp. RHB15-C17]AVY97814.1 LacI family transcriptional regulator [Lelliottia sp. WB101]MBF4176363.1 LacI family DNA-binding transcriptional regulator [Lelliottia nimipressuralis]MCD4558267.1 LacI family DNA-binding transcriptional regulator [Lelliottia nimi
MATMLDVSLRAGVSKATVSRVLNGTGQVKESTRQQVFNAMEELGYRPNFLAQSLANQTSNSIGLVVSTFDGFYFGRLLQQASRQTETHGKQLIVTDGHDAPEREEQAVQMLADRQCDAIVLYTRYMSEKAIMKLINSVKMPLVVINRDVSLARDRCVFFEQQEAAFKAVDYLISQGHREIACITVPIHTPTGKARLMGYRQALEKHGIAWDDRRVKYGDAGMTRGYELCNELLSEKVPFTALFACNDDMALGSSKALHQAGLHIPQDISLFGFDDAPSAKWLEPALSTVYLPIDNMIVTAIDQAVRLANHQPIETIPPFTGTLMLRDSVTTGPFYTSK